jgi:predicted SnoaL-like aldol condensation-catalyzing enzyme
MDTTSTKAIDLRYIDEVLNGRNLDAIDQICAESYVSHVPGMPDMDRAGDKQLVGSMFAGFPDLEFEVGDQIAEGDRVLHTLTGRGTHQAEFMGIPPTGRRVEVTGMNINRIAGGKIAESWGVIDILGLLQQLGVVPTPGASVGVEG